MSVVGAACGGEGSEDERGVDMGGDGGEATLRKCAKVDGEGRPAADPDRARGFYRAAAEQGPNIQNLIFMYFKSQMSCLHLARHTSIKRVFCWARLWRALISSIYIYIPQICLSRSISNSCR